MKTILKISWRNVWRNKARSLVIIMAIGFGLWGGIFATAFLNGMIEQMFDSGIKSQVSHVQIHHNEYDREKLTELYIDDSDEMINYLRESSDVMAFSARTLASGMFNTASMVAGVEIIGIDPEQEQMTTDLGGHLTDGMFFSNDVAHPVVIGKRLADKMKVETGSRIVLTFQNMNGDITSAAFRVAGLYRTSNSGNDERKVYILRNEMAELIGSSGIVNEIAILLDHHDKASEYSEYVSERFPGNEVRTWSEIAPELSFMTEFSGVAMLVLVIIILFAMAFGLLNTMLMTIFERTNELGVLMSVGMNKTRVFLMIMFETCFLVITGAVFGGLLGMLSVSVTRSRGIDLTSIGGEALLEYGIDTVVFPSLDQIFYVNLAVLVLITAVAASVYPAWKALRLNPAEAVRKE
jgi:putative ABC transport system permease protein